MSETRPIVVADCTGLKLSGQMPDLPSCRWITVDRDQPVDQIRAEVVVTRIDGSPQLAQLLDNGARWVHTIGTGIDEFPLELMGDQTLTCSRGVSGLPIGEFVLAQMLAHTKAFPEIWLDREPDRWADAKLVGTLRGQTVVVVGLGGIGTEVARLSLALGMHVVGVRRTNAASPIVGVDVTTNLSAAVGDADHVVLALPATSETEQLFDATMFDRLKPGTHLVNVARGALIDQEALRAALDSGQVSRASLDVSDPEPLPDGHWMYSDPRVKLSAHVSWASPTSLDDLLDVFRNNYRRYQNDEPLTGIVDVEAGY